MHQLQLNNTSLASTVEEWSQKDSPAGSQDRNHLVHALEKNLIHSQWKSESCPPYKHCGGLKKGKMLHWHMVSTPALVGN